MLKKGCITFQLLLKILILKKDSITSLRLLKVLILENDSITFLWLLKFFKIAILYNQIGRILVNSRFWRSFIIPYLWLTNVTCSECQI